MMKNSIFSENYENISEKVNFEAYSQKLSELALSISEKLKDIETSKNNDIDKVKRLLENIDNIL